MAVTAVVASRLAVFVLYFLMELALLRALCSHGLCAVYASVRHAMWAWPRSSAFGPHRLAFLEISLVEVW